MDEATSNYEILAEIGAGAYGTVYKARDLVDKQRLVAVKKLKFSAEQHLGIPNLMIREVALLRKTGLFDHPNVVKSHHSGSSISISICPLDLHTTEQFAQEPSSGMVGFELMTF